MKKDEKGSDIDLLVKLYVFEKGEDRLAANNRSRNLHRLWACAEFCSNDVFAFIDGVMTVANPRNCVPFCDGFAGECPVSAIMFSPKEKLLLQIEQLSRCRDLT
ncbi:MAG: hypothetical protein QME62_08465 [Armatimonadota bacterium]|nr:hypothetical protein [Armatimonadota bacterium]